MYYKYPYSNNMYNQNIRGYNNNMNNDRFIFGGLGVPLILGGLAGYAIGNNNRPQYYYPYPNTYYNNYYYPYPMYYN